MTKLLTTKEAMKALGYKNRKSVYRLIKNGTLPAIRREQSFLILRTGLESYLSENDVKGAHF